MSVSEIFEFVIKVQVYGILILYIIKAIPLLWESAEYKDFFYSLLQQLLIGVMVLLFSAFEIVLFTKEVNGLSDFITNFLNALIDLSKLMGTVGIAVLLLLFIYRLFMSQKADKQNRG